MTMPLAVATALWNHRHVSERESAHYWEDGRWDNRAWEDCFWDTLVEFVRMTLRPRVPATHDEAEALRTDAGEDTSSGSHSGDGNRGLKRRYGLGPLATHSDVEVLNMPIGFAAHVSGSMGAFPYGHRLRRHDADFRGFHRSLVFRLAGGWWWCDPLAPYSYSGEWISRADLAKFMAAFPGGDHYILPLLPKPAKPAPDPTPIARVRVIPGPFHLYDVNGNPTTGYGATTRVDKDTEKGFSGTVGKRINKLANGQPVVWQGAERDWVLITDPKSAYSGAWVDVNAGGVTLLDV
jgi:hypothetical protein